MKDERIYLTVARKDRQDCGDYMILKIFNAIVDNWNEVESIRKLYTGKGGFWRFVSDQYGCRVYGFDMKANIGNDAFKYVHLIMER